MDDEDGGLFAINLSDSETEETSTQTPRDRTGQTLEQWQAVKDTYRAKVEDGEVRTKVTLPLPKGAKKHLIHEVQYAAEELYFSKRYDEAKQFLAEVLNGESDEAFDDDTRKMLEMYQRRCEEKMNTDSNP